LHHVLRTLLYEFPTGKTFAFSSLQVSNTIICPQRRGTIIGLFSEDTVVTQAPFLNPKLFIFSEHRHGFVLFFVLRIVKPSNVTFFQNNNN